MFVLYNTLLHVALLLSLPLWPFILFSRARLYRGLSERLGFYPAAALRPLKGAHPIWIHAASVGEVTSAMPLLLELKRRFPGDKILVSTMTATGRRIAEEGLAGRDAVVYFPLDLPWTVNRALRQFDPSLLVLLETEVWPNVIHAAHRRGVPVALISGRLSLRSARRFRRFAGLFGRVLREISIFGMQDAENTARLLGLGVDPVRVWTTGSLKRAPLALPEAPPGLSSVRGVGSRPVIVIGSTHRGEEEIFVEAYRRLRARFPDLLLIVAPRHPERFEEVGKLLERSGLHHRKRSEAGPVDLRDSEVFLLDSLGELAWIYTWAAVIFVGGTLVEVGGHNVIEPARWAKPILLGPHTANVAEAARAMLETGGAVEVRNREDLVARLSELLSSPERAAEMGRRARAAAAADTDVVVRTVDLLYKLLPEGEGA